MVCIFTQGNYQLVWKTLTSSYVTSILRFLDPIQFLFDMWTSVTSPEAIQRPSDLLEEQLPVLWQNNAIQRPLDLLAEKLPVPIMSYGVSGSLLKLSPKAPVLERAAH